MANDSAVEFLLKFVVDKGSQAQAEAAIAALEKEGIKFNEKAGRYTLGGQFVSQKDVRRIYQEEILPAQQKVAQQTVQQNTLIEQQRAEWRAVSAEVDKQNNALLEQERIEVGQREIEKQRLAEQQAITKERNKQMGLERTRSRMEGRGGIGLMIGGMMAAQIGTALTSPVEAYIKYAGMADKTSREWLETQERIEKSTVKIGQNMAGVLAPVNKVKASLLEAVAQNKLLSGLAGGVGGVLKAGGGAASTAGQFLFAAAALKNFKFMGETAGKAATAMAASTVATEANTFAKGAETAASEGAAIADTEEAGASHTAAAADLEEAAASKTAGASGLLGKFGGGLVGIIKSVLPPIAAVYAGSLIAKPVARAAGNEAMGLGDIPKIAGQSIALLAGEFTAMSKGAEEGRKKVVEVSNALGLLGGKAGQAADAVNSQAAVDAFIKFRQAEVEAEQQYGEERSNIVKEAAQERADIEADYEKKRSEIVRDFAQSQAQALEDYNLSQEKAMRGLSKTDTEAENTYYEQRRKLLENYNVDLQRMEEDHQRKMLEMQQDNNDRVADLTDARDALGLWREKRDYERQRKQAEEEYGVEVARKNQDLARRLAEMDTEFAAARAKRLEEYRQERADAAAEFALKQARAKEEQKQRLADLDAEHKEELKLNDQQEKEKLLALDKQHQAEMSKMRAAFNDQLRELDAALLGETERKAQWYEYEGQMLDAYIAQWKGKYESNLPDMGGKAGIAGKDLMGGPIWKRGVYELAEDNKPEYVMNNRLMTLAENFAGGNLTNKNWNACC